jgi:hypothetical protein
VLIHDSAQDHLQMYEILAIEKLFHAEGLPRNLPVVLVDADAGHDSANVFGELVVQNRGWPLIRVFRDAVGGPGLDGTRHGAPRGGRGQPGAAGCARGSAMNADVRRLAVPVLSLCALLVLLVALVARLVLERAAHHDLLDFQHNAAELHDDLVAQGDALAASVRAYAGWNDTYALTPPTAANTWI